MAEGGEMRGFVFSLIFIIVFSTLLASVPVGLQGIGASPDTVVPIDPNLVTGFSDTANYTPAVLPTPPPIETYTYEDLGGRDWIAGMDLTSLYIYAKVLVWDFLWLGQTDNCKFIAPSGTDRGNALALSEIETDDEEGAVRYSMQFIESGDSAGSLVIYWNITEYPVFQDAWDAEEVYLLHGVGIDTSATTNIGALIVSLLFLQLPGVPVLVNMFLAVPIWACIVFVLWFIIKEMIPFV